MKFNFKDVVNSILGLDDNGEKIKSRKGETLVKYIDYDKNSGSIIHTKILVRDFAKLMVTKYGERANAWELLEEEIHKINSDKVIERIDFEIVKQQNRVKKFLQYYEILDRIHTD